MRWLAILAVLILIPMSVGQADPNPRADQALPHAASAVAISGDGSTLIVGMRDEGGAPPVGRGREDTWIIYDILEASLNIRQDGDIEPDGGGSTDPTDCDNAIVSGNDCIAHVSHVAISRNGMRAVAAGQSDTNVGQVVFINKDQGERAQAEVPGVITGIAISQDGNRVAVGLRDPGVSNPSGTVLLYTWGSFNVVSRDTTSAVRAIAMTPDGQRIMVAAGVDHYILKGDGGILYKDSKMPGTGVTAVAVSSLPGHYSIAGGDKGDVRVYSDDASASSDPVFNMPGPQKAVTRVSISADASRIAIAYEGGRVDVWTLKPALYLPDKRILTTEAGAEITQLTFTRDSNYLFMRAGDKTRLLTAGAPVREVVNATLASTVATAIDDRGDRIAALAGTQLRLYEADHRLEYELVGIGDLLPGKTAVGQLAVGNIGNRHQVGILGGAGPAGWSVAVSKPVIALMPGEEMTTNITIHVTDHHEPVVESIHLSAALLSGYNNRTYDVTVPEYESFVLSRTNAPTSLAVEAGRSAVFQLTVRNAGNTVGEPPLNIRTEGQGWRAAIQAGDGTMAPGDVQPVEIALTAPNHATQLAQGRVFISIGQEPEIELVATVGAKFGVVLGGLQERNVPAGAELRFNITITNTGNALDSYKLQWGNVPAGWSIAFAESRSYEVKDLPAGQSRPVPAVTTSPLGAETGGAIGVSLAAVSLADESKQDAAFVTFRPVAADAPEPGPTDPKPGKKGPGIGLPLLLAGLVALSLWRRR